MVVSARVLVVLLAVGAARAHIASHDNILRIQLWDADGLSKEPITTEKPTTIKSRKSKVNLESLYNAMVYDSFGGDFGRFSRRHKVRHKRRRPRQAGSELPWSFHGAEGSLNVAVYDDAVPWSEIEGVNSSVSAVVPSRYVPAPMTLRQDEDEGDEEDEEVKKQLPVVRKCCAIGQNLSATLVDGKRVCQPTYLTFQPVFYQLNETHMWTYDSNVFETIIHNPCSYDRYKLDPSSGDDEFYLLVNGSLFTPINKPTLRTLDYCMETFYNESNPTGAGITLPLVCFPETDKAETTSNTLIAYAIGLIISVPFLLATAFIYTFITELRDTHGKALACHSTCLALAFACLAATQLAGHAFPAMACTVMAYMIQFSFVSCFFWLNVMCFDTFLNVRRYINCSVTRRSMRRRFAWYCAYAVLLPLLLLVVTITMELSPAVPSSYLKPNFGVKGCWFKTDKAALPYFYGPVSAILLANIVIFFFTSRAFAVHYDKMKDVTALEMTHSDYSTSDDWVRLGAALGETLPVHQRTASPPRERPVNFTQRLKKYRKIFRTCCMLSVIMGLTWVMEVVSWAVGAGSDVVSVWSLFDVINALQGVVIFGIFVLQQPVRAHVNVSLSRLCRRTSSSEVAVVSERTSIDYGTGRRDYV